MKLSAVLSAVAMAAAAFCGQAFAAPHINWIKNFHQFGAFSEDLESVTCTFRGVNTGDETLVIYDVRTNCGCTTTDRYAGREYAPGDTIEINATYNASGRPGKFTKKVMVTTNADVQKSNLTMSGTVIGSASTLKSRYPVEAGPVRMHSSMAPMGTVTKGRTAGAYIKAYNQSADTLAPVVVSAPKYLSVLFEPAKVKPGEQFVVSLSYHSGNNSRWGLQNDTIVIAPSAEAAADPEEHITLSTVVTVNEDFSRLTPEQREKAPRIVLDPAVVDLQRISRSAGSKIERRVELRNEGRSELVIRQASCVNPAIDFKIKSQRVKPGKSTEIDITVDLDRNPNAELIDGRIIIITNDCNQPSTVLRVVGEITD